MDFAGLYPPGPGSLVVVGDNDPLAPHKEVEEWMKGSGVEMKTIHGADHFYGGAEAWVEEEVRSWAAGLLEEL
jgi:alpha/beta superfamily hydrolase